MIGEKAYYPGRRDRYNAICVAQSAYLYPGYARGGKYLLKLEKRALYPLGHSRLSACRIIRIS